MIPTRTLRLFGALLAREITMTLHYRWWLAMIQVSSIIAPATSLLVWRGAIALGARPPVSASFLTTYLILVSIVAMLTSSWTSTFLATSIRLGGLSSWLIRPCSTHLAHMMSPASPSRSRAPTISTRTCAMARCSLRWSPRPRSGSCSPGPRGRRA